MDNNYVFMICSVVRKNVDLYTLERYCCSSSYGDSRLMVFSDGLHLRVRVFVFNATFNNISVISWWSVLLVEETGGPGENHLPVQTLSHECCIEYTSPSAGFELTTLVVIGTECTGSRKSNNHTTMTMMAPVYI